MKAQGAYTASLLDAIPGRADLGKRVGAFSGSFASSRATRPMAGANSTRSARPARQLRPRRARQGGHAQDHRYRRRDGGAWRQALRHQLRPALRRTAARSRPASPRAARKMPPSPSTTPPTGTRRNRRPDRPRRIRPDLVERRFQDALFHPHEAPEAHRSGHREIQGRHARSLEPEIRSRAALRLAHRPRPRLHGGRDAGPGIRARLAGRGPHLRQRRAERVQDLDRPRPPRPRAPPPGRSSPTRADGITSLDVHGTTLFLLSHKGAPTFQVLSVPAGKPLPRPRCWSPRRPTASSRASMPPPTASMC